MRYADRRMSKFDSAATAERWSVLVRKESGQASGTKTATSRDQKETWALSRRNNDRTGVFIRLTYEQKETLEWLSHVTGLDYSSIVKEQIAQFLLNETKMAKYREASQAIAAARKAFNDDDD